MKQRFTVLDADKAAVRAFVRSHLQQDGPAVDVGRSVMVGVAILAGALTLFTRM